METDHINWFTTVTENMLKMGASTFSIMAISITTLSITTLSIVALSIATLSITTLSIIMNKMRHSA